MAPWFEFFERRQPHREAGQPTLPDDAVPLAILSGLGRYSSGIARVLSERGRQVLGGDFNPDLVRARGVKEGSVVFVDAEDPEFIATLPLGRAQWAGGGGQTGTGGCRSGSDALCGCRPQGV